MKKTIVILNIALCLFACKKDTPVNQSTTSQNIQTLTPGNTNLVGVWVQDSITIVNSPPTTKDNPYPAETGKYPGRVWDTIYMSATTFHENAWYDWSDTTVWSDPSYECYQFPLSIWQTPYSDSLFVTYMVSNVNDWSQHFYYSITGKELYLLTGCFSQTSLPLEKSQPVKYWYHKL